MAINSLFGRFTVSNATKRIFWEDVDASENAEKDFVLRETGIAREYKHIARATEALSDPESYLSRKNEALAILADNVRTKFDQVFKEYMRRGFSEKDARDRALEEAKREKGILLELHIEEYPTKIRDMSLRDVNK